MVMPPAVVLARHVGAARAVMLACVAAAMPSTGARLRASPPGGFPSTNLPAIASVVHSSSTADDRSWNATAAICLALKGNEAELDEWVSYHLGLGFDEIYVYDNSASSATNYSLVHWARMASWTMEQAGGEQRHGLRVHVQPWPDHTPHQQIHAYQHCVDHHLKPRGVTWVAFFDIDEFLVLKNHSSVVPFLIERSPPRGSVAVNWVLFGTSNHTQKVNDAPVTLTYQHRVSDRPDSVIKSIARVDDFERMRNNPHSVWFTDEAEAAGAVQVDTLGRPIDGGRASTRATSSFRAAEWAVLHHYRYKSLEEWHWRNCIRGGAGHTHDHKPLCNTTAPAGDVALVDDAAWKTLQRVVPHYRLENTWTKAGGKNTKSKNISVVDWVPPPSTASAELPAFNHIPKTGGTSIEFWLQRYLEGYKRPLKDKCVTRSGATTVTGLHCNHRGMHAASMHHETFCVIRHPLDRLMSSYNMRMRKKIASGKMKERTPCNSNATLGWAKTIIAEGEKDNHDVPETDFHCTYYLCFDRLQGDFNTFVKAFNFATGKLNHFRKAGTMQKEDVSNHSKFACTLDAGTNQELRLLVREHFALDYALYDTVCNNHHTVVRNLQPGSW